MPSLRDLDIVLLGATGYTGKLCAEHIITHLPADLKWAVAGRSSSRLADVVNELKALNPDRVQPAIETVRLNKEDLTALARKTRLVINCVGPYHIYSTPVVEACAENGTHYLDVTGETPWVLEMIQKYHETAKANGGIIIPEIGIESAPSDLIAWVLVKLIREKLSCGTAEVICSVEQLISAGFSGGSLATGLGILENYGLSAVAKSTKPYSLSPAPPTHPSGKRTFMQKLFGVQFIPDLGTLAPSIMGASNVAIVHRSSGLMSGLYGSHFRFYEYMRVRNSVIGAALHFAIVFATIALTMPPVRWLLKKFIYAPGQGPSKEDTKKDRLEYRAIAVADQDTPKPQRAYGRFLYEGGLYYVTGLFLAEAAMVILKNETLAKKLGGGILTPAMLGQAYVDRLQRVGVQIEAELMNH